MSTIRQLVVQVLFCCSTALSVLAQSPSVTPNHLAHGTSLAFTENRGQVRDTRGMPRSDIAFTASTAGMRLFFTNHGVSYVFLKLDESNTTDSSNRFMPPALVELYRMDLDLIGSNPDALITGEEQTPWHTRYDIGPHTTKGSVYSYHRLIYHDVYPNIDLMFYASENGMKYDFIVHPGGQVSDIKLRYVAADSVRLGATGTVRAVNKLGSIEEATPWCYQTKLVKEQTTQQIETSIPSRYRFNHGVIDFQVGAYDSSRVLVIDPAVEWATFAGGSGDERANAVAVDIERNAYVTGFTTSVDFPVTPGAWQPTFAGGTSGGLNSDAFILKFDVAGKLLWATYLGGEGDDVATAISIDTKSNIVVTGGTRSTAFPTTAGAFQRTLDASDYDVFLLKMKPDGSLVWSTYCGGNGKDYAYDIAVDSTNHIIIVGETSSTNFPVTSNALQTTFGGKPYPTAPGDFFIARFTTDGARDWATYYGGNSREVCYGVATDRAENIFVVGYTGGGSFPMPPGSSQNSVIGITDAVLLKLSSKGEMLWGTLFGGNDSDEGHGVSVTFVGDPVMVGTTSSDNLITTAGAPQSKYGGGFDAFLLKLTAGGNRAWSTYYGGIGGEEGRRVACDWLTRGIVFSGYTSSGNFPLPSGAIQPKIGGVTDAYIVRLDTNGRPLWGTYLGGAGLDEAAGLAVDFRGGIMIAGYTNSPAFPVYNAEQASLAGYYDSFVARFGCELDVDVNITGDTAACTSVPAQLEAPAGFDFYRWSDGSTTRQVSLTKPGVYTVAVADSLGCSAISPPFTVRPAVNVLVTPTGNVVVCNGDSVKLRAPAGFNSYTWSTGDTTQDITVYQPGSYSVTVTDSLGCSGTAAQVVVTNFPVPPAPVISQCGYTLSSTPATGYFWAHNGIPVVGAHSQSFEAPAPGFYSVAIIDSNGCVAFSDNFELTGESIASATVSLPQTIAADPGNRLCIPIVLDTSRGLGEPPYFFRTSISYDKSLLLPTDPDAVVSTDGNGRQRVEVLREWTGVGDTLTVVNFTALLGDTDRSIIDVSDFTWQTACPVFVTSNSGELQMSVCRAGANRVVSVNGNVGLKPISPNPSTGSAHVEYELVESGMTSLSITDIYGRELYPLPARSMDPGTYSMNLDTSTLPPGLYLFVLQTPTQRFTQPLVVAQ